MAGDASKPPLVTTVATSDASRRRVAPRATETSDVTRFRGLWGGALAGAVACAVVLMVFGGARSLRAPGPLSRPHEQASLKCEACHRGDEPAARACARCHSELPSTRPAHQSARQRGELGCPSCHAIHRFDDGVTFLPDGRAVRYAAGFEQAATLTGLGFLPQKPVSVPLVPARACAGCHDIASRSDPIFACLIEGQAGLGLDRPTVCFDEHRALGERAGVGAKVAPGATAARDAAWEAARRVAARSGRPAARHRASVPLGALASGFLVALSVWGGALARARRRRRRLEVERAASIEARPSTVHRLPRIDATTCLGCQACVDACPYDVIEMRKFVAVVARPDDCCGLTLCEQRCPNGSLVVRAGEPIDDRPRVDSRLESQDVPGLYLAGDLTGLPLIRNAINQGVTAVRSIAASLSESSAGPDCLDLLIVGAGPAGISAALEAKVQKLSAKTLEQGSVAASIRSFPRGKLVFDQPLEMPLSGELWLEESTKEELLGKWMRIVRRAELDIVEGLRVTRVTAAADGAFEVEALGPDGRCERHRARRVLLAIGRRGSAKKLDAPVAEAAEDHVHYALADARTFAGQRVVIVGLGDSAMEAAIALCRQPDTTVTLLYRGNEFRRGKSRNIDEVKRLVNKGKLEIRFRAEVVRIEPGRVVARVGAQDVQLDVHAVFVLIGAILPWDFLASLGLRRGGAAVGEPPASRGGG